MPEAWADRGDRPFIAGDHLAYDGARGGDPRGPWCPKCQQPVREGEPTTHMQFSSDSEERLSGLWHAECARPFWDTLSPLLERLKSWGGGL